MNPVKNEAIKLKLLKTKALLNEADVLLQNKFYLTAVNRLYYACFYATKALLLTKDLIPKTHNGVVNMLHEHFVQPGKFDFMQASFYSKLMQQRIHDDYSDDMDENEENASEFLAGVKLYIDYIDKIINTYFLNHPLS